jgi:hypothetical protein
MFFVERPKLTKKKYKEKTKVFRWKVVFNWLV